jgi:hypothetical protein
MKARELLGVLGVVVALGTASCGRATFVVQQYPGPARPAESVAVLRMNGNEDVRVLELDDRDVRAPIDRDVRIHIEMLPARHTVVVGAMGFENDPRAPTSGKLAFRAEPGKVYRVAIGESPKDAHVYEVDRSSDAVVREATEVAPPPAPAPAPAAETPRGPAPEEAQPAPAPSP